MVRPHVLFTSAAHRQYYNMILRRWCDRLTEARDCVESALLPITPLLLRADRICPGLHFVVHHLLVNKIVDQRVLYKLIVALQNHNRVNKTVISTRRTVHKLYTIFIHKLSSRKTMQQ